MVVCRPGSRVVLTIGTFDLFHAGHARLLARSSELGLLYVGVNSDDFVESYKGKRPALPLAQRFATVDALPFVAATLPNHDAGFTLIERVKPDLLVVGSDWHARDYLAQIGMTQERVDELRIGLVYVPYTAGVSSTMIRAALA